MAETVPSSPEKNVVVTSSHLGRLWTLTLASLALNALILVLLLVGTIIHHHDRRGGFAGRYGHGGGCFIGHYQSGGGYPFHRFGGPGWGPPGGFGGGRGGDRFRGDDNDRGPGGPPPGMPGMGGMPGMMGGPMGKPDPARMTDSILNHLSTALSLTDDEKAKIKPIVEQQVADIQKQMEAQRQAVQKQIEDTKAKIKPLLTPDQQKQLDAMPLPGQKPPAPDDAQPPDPKPGQ